MGVLMRLWLYLPAAVAAVLTGTICVCAAAPMARGGGGAFVHAGRRSPRRGPQEVLQRTGRGMAFVRAGGRWASLWPEPPMAMIHPGTISPMAYQNRTPRRPPPSQLSLCLTIVALRPRRPPVSGRVSSWLAGQRGMGRTCRMWSMAVLCHAVIRLLSRACETRSQIR